MSVVRFASVCIFAWLGLGVCASPQAAAPRLERKDPVMTRLAKGTFDAKTTPIAAEDATNDTAIGRFALDKQYHGDLEGTSKGEMLGAGNPATGNAGYVAIERFNGILEGQSGSFSLQHMGTMNHGKYELTVLVVPGSGTGGLTGIDGKMKIIIAGGKHSYEFEYTLPAPQ
jgi:hypothetical protein